MMQAIVLKQDKNKTVTSLESLNHTQLSTGNVTINVEWSSLNYKDALAITGKGKVVKTFPMIPGIDLAGCVGESQDPRFKVGDHVLLTGYGVGESHSGGLAQQARVNADWLVQLPTGLTTRNAMIIGTAGLTAMLCVMALEDAGITPDSGNIVVSGSTGGVGSTAIALLSALGYSVYAISGRIEYSHYLTQLGAKQIINRADYLKTPRPLEKQCWAGAIDTVGGSLLATLLAQMQYNGTVAACGLVGDYQLPTTVMPFILRNVRLQGVDSVMTPMDKRIIAWRRLTAILPENFYQLCTHQITLNQVIQTAYDLLDNKITGRTLVKI